MKKLLFDKSGALRRGIRLSLALAAVLLTAWLVPLGFSGLSTVLFTAWGVTPENVSRAPGWVQFLFAGWLHIGSFAQGGAVALVSLLMGRALGARIRMGKGIAAGFLAGAAVAGGMLLLFRLLDVMRFGYALSRPRLGGLSFVLLASAAAQALGAALATGLIGEVLSGWRRALALFGCALFYALLFGRWTIVGLLNGALFGLLLWLAREKKGGFAPAFGFLAAFSTLTVVVFGLPVWQTGALYETYPVSKSWLTGGEGGAWTGLLMTAALLLLTLALALPSRKTKAAPPARPAKPRSSGKN